MRDARDHGILNVIVLFPGHQVILVHLLLHIGHVSVRLQSLSTLYLLIKLVFVQLLSFTSIIFSSLLILIVEDAELLSS